MKRHLLKFTTLLLAVLAFVFVLLAVVGAMNSYSPVPFWDMWNGYLDFYVKAIDGNSQVWWMQHNEHRIVLARLLFFVDIYYLNGNGIFLIASNYVFAGLSFVCFYRILKLQLPKSDDKHIGLAISFFILILTYSWIQQDNFSVGFQTQFFLAFLCPLVAFFLLYYSLISNRFRTLFFLLSCIAGVASAGSMANGVLALPLMVIMAMVFRMNWRYILVLCITSAIVIFLYLYGYTSVQGHGSLREALLHHPFGLVRFVLLYIGGPFYYILRRINYLSAEIAGVLLIAGSAFFAYKAARRLHESSLEIVLLVFILYIGATAFGTAGGRLIFGFDAAITSRYMTPALMAWSALLILCAPAIARSLAGTGFALGVMTIIAFLMLPEQLNALKPREAESFERMLGALALELGAKDRDQVGRLFPSVDWAIEHTQVPVARDLSIFGNPSIRDAREAIGHAETQSSDIACIGHLDELSLIQGEERFMGVRGWVFSPTDAKAPTRLHLVDDQNRVVGYAITGQPRPDVGRAIDKKAQMSGFKGYLLKETAGERLTVQGLDPGCHLPLAIPASAYRIRRAELHSGERVATVQSIVEENKWKGTDSQRTSIDGYVVLGSWVTSDSDTGSISLRLKRGDSLYYRSGPNGGRQFLSIDSTIQFRETLVTAIDWVRLEFSNTSLPDEFTITLSDDGKGWGEWSAVALGTSH